MVIWQGGARTKKVISVEDKLRTALGVSLAIGGVARSKDGTYIVPGDRPSTPPSPNAGSVETGDEKDRENLREITEEDDEGRDEEQPRRRSTVAFGNVAEKPEGRQRGATVAAPELASPIGGLGHEGDMEMRAVSSKSVTEAK